MRSIAVVVLAAILTACGSYAPSAPTGPVNAQIVLAPGESTDIAAAGIRVRFQSVIADSRCPADAVCITGGDAIVRIDVTSSAGATSTYDLHTGSLQPVLHDDLTIALENLTPYPFSSRPIAPEEYRATLRVTR